MAWRETEQLRSATDVITIACCACDHENPVDFDQGRFLSAGGQPVKCGKCGTWLEVGGADERTDMPLDGALAHLRAHLHEILPVTVNREPASGDFPLVRIGGQWI